MTAEPPTLAVIADELAVYKQWRQEYLSGVQPNTILPNMDDRGPSAWVGIPSVAIHAALVFGGRLATKVHLHRLRIWFARKEVQLDHLWYEPVACGLNKAYTSLGLALLAMGEHAQAIDALSRSWRVHPCPHNTTFGLKTALWRALEGVPDATAVREEYEQVARQFQLGGEWPASIPPLRLSELSGVLWDMWRQRAR